MLKRFICTLIALSFLLALPLCVNAQSAPEIHSESAIVINLKNGQSIYEKEPDVQRAPASLTKITTTMTVLTMCSDPDNTYITVPDGIFEEITAVGGSNIALQPGEVLSVTDLLYAAMLPSACDACSVLAYHYGNGSIDAFADKMNYWAQSVGAMSSNFENAHGLDAPGHVSTARDTATIILAALENERFVEIINTLDYPLLNPTAEELAANPNDKTHLFSPRYTINYETTIPMLYSYKSEYYEGLVGVKSGYTLEAKCCLSTTAHRGNESFLVVCLGAERENGVNLSRTDTRTLYDWAFSNFETKTVQKAGDVVKTVSLLGASTDTADLVLDEDFVVSAKKGGGDITVEIDVAETVSAPFPTDRYAGTAVAWQDEEVIGTADVYFKTLPVAGETKNPTSPGATEEGSNPIVVTAVVVVCVLVVLGTGVIYLARPQKKKKRPAPPKR